MFKLQAKVLALAVCAALTMAAVAAASASAAEWVEEGGGALAKTETIATTTLGGLVRLKTTLPGGAKIVIGCFRVRALGAHISPGTTNNAQGIELSECKVDEPTGCTISATLLTKPVTSALVQLVAGSEPVFITFTPTVNDELIVIAITDCPDEGIFKVKFKTACEVLAAAVLAIIKLCLFKPNLFNTLKFGTSAAQLEGTVGLQLIGAKKGQKWGIRP